MRYHIVSDNLYFLLGVRGLFNRKGLFAFIYYSCEQSTLELMRDINTDPEMFYAAVLNMLQLASELCVSLILVGYLLVKDALLTLGVAFAMVVMVFIFMKKLRRTLARFGDDRRKYNANILQCMQQAFGGIKEIKIANRVFAPSVEDIAHARRVKAAMGDGTGAVMIDGKMEDDASLKQCLVQVELAEQLAAIDPELKAAYDAIETPEEA